MLLALRRWMTDLSLSDPVEQQQAIMLQYLLLGITVIVMIGALLSFLSPGMLFTQIVTAIIMLICALGMIASLLLLRRGSFRPAANLSIIVMTLVAGILTYLSGIRYNQILMFALAAPMILASLISNRRMIIMVGALLVLSFALAAIAEQYPLPFALLLPHGSDEPVSTIAGFIVVVLLTGMLLERFSTSLRRSLQESLEQRRQLEQLREDL